MIRMYSLWSFNELPLGSLLSRISVLLVLSEAFGPTAPVVRLSVVSRAFNFHEIARLPIVQKRFVEFMAIGNGSANPANGACKCICPDEGLGEGPTAQGANDKNC